MGACVRPGDMLEEKPVKEKKKILLKWSSPTAWILVVSFAVSAVTLIIYLAERGFSDEVLFLLLRIISYSAFMVFICSLYKLVLNFVRFILKHQRFHRVKIIIYFIFLFYGIFFFLFEALISAISGGNE